MEQKKPSTTPEKKKVYRAPVLKTHGDLTTLTAVKGGAMNDGAGKPMTRMSGGNA